MSHYLGIISMYLLQSQGASVGFQKQHIVSLLLLSCYMNDYHRQRNWKWERLEDLPQFVATPHLVIIMSCHHKKNE